MDAKLTEIPGLKQKVIKYVHGHANNSIQYQQHYPNQSHLTTCLFIVTGVELAGLSRRRGFHWQ